MVKRIVQFLIVILFIVSDICFLTAQENRKDETIPEWITTKRLIKGSEIPEEDYQFIASWLEEHSKPAQQYIIGLFEEHDVVIFGEGHNVKEHKDFIIEIIPRLYYEAGVRCVGLEICKHIENERLNKLITSLEYNQELALQIARDQLAHEWNSKEHWDIMEAVWQVNKNLSTEEEKMRLIGLFMDFDWTQFFITIKTKPKDSPEVQEMIKKVALQCDKVMAEQVEKEIIEKDQKGLLFVGRCHDFTHYEYPPDLWWGRPIMGNILYKKYGDHVFQVWPGNGFLPVIENVMKLKGHEPVGFDLYNSPFANILSPPNWDAPEVPLSRIARGFVYLGPKSNLHKNTPIEGFVTKEMFEKYKYYYEIDFGQKFNSAEDVDKYLYDNRFPKP